MYSGLHDHAEWVLPRALEEAGHTHPARLWVMETGGARLSYGEAAAQMHAVAGFFSGLGVAPGDRVAVMLPNSLDFVRAWMGLGRLGAVAVFINTELRGAFLQHQLVQSAVERMVIHASLLPALAGLDRSGMALRQLVVVADDAAGLSGGAGESRAQEARQGEPPELADLEKLTFAAACRAPPHAGAWPKPTDIAGIMYTSGTSGPAKGVLLPHAHVFLFGVGGQKATQLQPDDRYYIPMPLFHVNALGMQLAATLLCGASAVLRARFSAGEWVADIRRFSATATNLLGVQAAFVVAQPRGENDAAHELRVIVNAPSIPEHEQTLRERFGVRDVISGFGMTEVNIPVWGRLGESRPGAAGWPHREHFEVIIADPETDVERPRGEVGEILVRPKVPFGFMAGYFREPAKTVEAWRNLWFHTGDAGTMGEDGLVTFIDRIKDCIRRRGENISATEVEQVVCGLPGVAEVAAYAVKSEIAGGEDEVMLAVVLAPEATLGAAEIGERAAALLPRFANPRFIALLPELPKTSTGKVQREVLRKRGTAGALDRQEPRARSR